METIKNYLDNMFTAFPETAEIKKLKEELLCSMEDKYLELKSSNKSENEAIGIVISEFGNIEELVNELNLSPSISSLENTATVLRMNDIHEILITIKKYSKLIAIGVWLCIMGAATFLLLDGFVESKINQFSSTSPLSGKTEFLEVLPLVPLLFLVAIAVSLFIYSSSHIGKYTALLQNPFTLDFGVDTFVKQEKENFRPTFTLMITIGVILCIFSALALILLTSLFDTDFGNGIALFISLSMVSFAVFGFIRVGNVMGIYEQLLHEKEYAPMNKRENKLVSIVASIVWPITTAFYLLWSFLGNAWHISWIVWPITGILFGAFAAVCNIVVKEEIKL